MHSAAFQDSYAVPAKKSVVPVSPVGKYFVEMERSVDGRGGQYRDKSEGGIIIDPAFDSGEHAEVTGVIRSVPRRGGINGLQVGDNIAFSYLVVADERVIGADNEEVFYEDVQLKPTVMTWSNKNGETLTRQYLMNDKFCAAKTGKGGVVIDFIEGKFGEVESWLEKNKFRERAGFVNTNMLEVDGREYWSVSSDLVYAVKRGDARECVPGYLMCSIPVASAEKSAGAIEVVGGDEKKGPAWLSVKLGSYLGEIGTKHEIYVNTKYCPVYKFWGEEYMVVREDQVLLSRKACCAGKCSCKK